MSYLTQVYTNTLSNQNISSALLAGTFTNTTRIRKVYVNVFCDQIAGNGDYVVYATVQRAGTGSAYRAQPSTTATVASGVTSVLFQSIAVTLNATDVLKVYVTGLAGDTTTPDIIVDVNEEIVDPADLWAYATRTLTSGAVTAATVSNTRITAYRGTTWSIALTGLGALTGYSKLYFTVKRTQDDTDLQALVQMEIAGGLTRLNGASYTTTSDGSITVNDASAGNITIVLKPAASAQLTLGTNYYFDVKSVISSVVTENAAGYLTISGDITRKVS